MDLLHTFCMFMIQIYIYIYTLPQVYNILPKAKLLYATHLHNQLDI